jgi:hypothetical protein
MPHHFVSTDRNDSSLDHSPIGNRARAFRTGRVAIVADRVRRGRALAAAVRQFVDDEIDDDDLREHISDAHVDVSRLRGHLGEIIAEHFCVCSDCSSLEKQDDCTSDGDRTYCESCMENYYRCEHCDNLVHSDDVTCVNACAVCDHCLGENYHYWESDGEWHDEPESCGNIHPYNVTLTGPLGSLPNDRRANHVLGIELEMEVDDPGDYASELDDLRARQMTAIASKTDRLTMNAASKSSRDRARSRHFCRS